MEEIAELCVMEALTVAAPAGESQAGHQPEPGEVARALRGSAADVVRILLHDPSPPVRKAAEGVLPCLGDAALSPLLAGLVEAEATGREEAAWIVGQAGLSSPRSTEVAKALLTAASNDRESSVRLAALRRLAALQWSEKKPQVDPGLVAKTVGNASQDASAEVRATALEILLVWPQAASDVEVKRALARAQSDTDPGVRSMASKASAQGGDLAGFARLLGDPDGFTRRKAIEDLTATHAAAIPVVLAALARPDETTRVAALTALQSIAQRRDTAGAEATIVPVLRGLLADRSPQVRMFACRDIGIIGSREVITDLPPLLADPDPTVRAEAVSATANFVWQGKNPADRPAVVKSLLAALQDASPMVRAASVGVLGDVRDRTDATVVPRIVKLLDDPDLEVREAARISLGRCGREGEQALELFEAHASTPGSAGEAPGAPAPGTLPALIETLQHGGEPALHDAVARVRAMNATDQAITALRSSLKDERVSVRFASVTSLADFGPDATAAVDDLVARLDDPDLYLRWATAQALGAIGPSAYAALPRLRKLLWDSDNEMRHSAGSALPIVASGHGDELMAVLKTKGLPESAISGLSEGLAAIEPKEAATLLPTLSALLKDPTISVAIKNGILTLQERSETAGQTSP